MRLLTVAAILGFLLFAPAPLASQDESISPPDTTDLVQQARERQAEFETFRASRIPVAVSRFRPTCDEEIGRICIWFGGEGEALIPPERPEVGEARIELIAFLTETMERRPDIGLDSYDRLFPSHQ